MTFPRIGQILDRYLLSLLIVGLVLTSLREQKELRLADAKLIAISSSNTVVLREIRDSQAMLRMSQAEIVRLQQMISRYEKQQARSMCKFELHDAHDERQFQAIQKELDRLRGLSQGAQHE